MLGVMRESGGRLGDRERLGALHRSLLLDSAPEAVFDRLSEIVCDALSVPVAMLTLIDDIGSPQFPDAPQASRYT